MAPILREGGAFTDPWSGWREDPIAGGCGGRYGFSYLPANQCERRKNVCRGWPQLVSPGLAVASRSSCRRASPCRAWPHAVVCRGAPPAAATNPGWRRKHGEDGVGVDGRRGWPGGIKRGHWAPGRGRVRRRIDLGLVGVARLGCQPIIGSLCLFVGLQLNGRCPLCQRWGDPGRGQHDGWRTASAVHGPYTLEALS